MSSNGNRKHQRSKEEWADFIRDFNASGLSHHEFCKQNNISSEYFHRLVRNSFKEDAPIKPPLTSKTSFIPIELSDSSARDKLPSIANNQSALVNIKSAIKINFANGISVEFANGCSGLEINAVKDLLYANK